MFNNIIQPHFEREFHRDSKKAIEAAQAYQARNQLLWGCLLCGYALVILTSTLIFALSRSTHFKVACSLLAFTSVSCFAYFHLHILQDSDRLLTWSGKLRLHALALKLKKQKDFLLTAKITAAALVATPFVCGTVLTAFGRSGWYPPESQEAIAYADSGKQLATLAGALLAAQITIFNFLFGQILGKFSSTLAVAISRHATLRLLRGHALAVLCTYYLSRLFGLPSTVKTVEFLIVFSLLANYVVTLWVSGVGLQIDKALLYTGTHAERQIHNAAKAPVLPTGKRTWRWLQELGLDWRDPSRIGGASVPTLMSTSAGAAFIGLMNAAHKCISDNQQESLLASLQALQVVLKAYCTERSKYYGLTDSTISFLNDQYAGLLQAAKVSRNEYLITNVVFYIGLAANTVIEVGWKRSGEIQDYVRPQSHQYFGYWTQLLLEAFDLSHELKRSASASNAITALSNLGVRAVQLGYYDDVSLTLTRDLNAIFEKSIKIGDVYHLMLCNEVVQALMTTWRASTQTEALFQLNEKLADLIGALLVKFATVQQMSSISLQDPFTSTTTKTGDNVTFQDIFMYTSHGREANASQARLVGDALKKQIEIVRRLVVTTAAADLVFTRSLTETLYECVLCSCFAIRSLQNRVRGDAQTGKAQASLLQAAWKGLGDVLFRLSLSKWNPTETMQHVASVLGIASLVSIEGVTLDCRQIFTDEVKAYFGLLKTAVDKDKEVSYQAWGYLQLLGAWTLLAEDDALGEEIALYISEHRERRFSSHAFSPMHSQGYPWGGGLMQDDFHLARPMNIQSALKKDGWERLSNWDDKLTDEIHLGRYALRCQSERT